VSALSRSVNGQYSLLVTWMPPEFNRNAVTGYYVKYRTHTENKYMSVS
jgi:hypothetical protein